MQDTKWQEYIKEIYRSSKSVLLWCFTNSYMKTSLFSLVLHIA